MMQKYLIHISEIAKQMLHSHATFLEQVSESAGERLVTSFVDAAKSLESMPERCSWYKGNYVPRNLYRCLLFEKRYALIFQVEETTVYVDYVII